MAEKGERLVANPELSTNDRMRVKFLLDNALSGWIMVIFAMLVPFACLYYVLNWQARATLWTEIEGRNGMQTEVDRLHSLSFRSMAAVCPVGGAMARFERWIFHRILHALRRNSWPFDDMVLKLMSSFHRPVWHWHKPSFGA